MTMIDEERIAFMTGVSNEALDDPDGLAASLIEIYELSREMLGQAHDPFFANRCRKQIEILDEMWTNPTIPQPAEIPPPPGEDE